MDRTRLRAPALDTYKARSASALTCLEGWGMATAVLVALLLPVPLYLGFQRAGFEQLLGLSRVQLAGEEPWLIHAIVLSTSALLLMPAVVGAVVLEHCGQKRGSRRWFLTLSSIAVFALLMDLDLLRSIGRHVWELIEVALLPEGRVAAGKGVRTWLFPIVKWSALSILTTTSLTLACQRLVKTVAPRLTWLVQRTLGGATCVSLAMLAIAPQSMRDGWRNGPLFERMHGTLFMDTRWSDADANNLAFADPVMRTLYPSLRESYRTAYPTMLTGKPADPSPIPLPERPPNVVLIVTESLRQDVFAEELMPRLSRWAKDGLVATQHGCGTIYSQAALFALMYGRSPAVFHQTLDAAVPPQMCVTLRASGYECAYFSGHPKVWLRREEYINERTMDHFFHDDHGTWPEWDARALDNMVTMLETSAKPIFATVLLMSSHFEYQYPPEYEIDRPVSNSLWQVTMTSTLGPEEEIPQRNRYRNSVRFIDDVVANAIEQLDPRKNLIIFTGDHGESLNDDGHYSHGYAFSEVVTRTPLAMVGPGVAPTRLERPTGHVDVLPTVLHVLSGSEQNIAHTHGVDWLASEPPVSSLETYSPDSREKVKAQLRVDGVYLRLDLDMRSPNVTILGFEDRFGNLVPTPELSSASTERIATAFRQELSLLRQ